MGWMERHGNWIAAVMLTAAAVFAGFGYGAHTPSTDVEWTNGFFIAAYGLAALAVVLFIRSNRPKAKETPPDHVTGWEALDPEGKLPHERNESRQELEHGSMTRWEEITRGQNANPNPPTIEATDQPELRHLTKRLREQWEKRKNEPRADLAVVVDQEEWDMFDYQAFILKAHVVVHNQTDREKKLTGISIMSAAGKSVSPDAGRAVSTIEVLREVERRGVGLQLLKHVSIVSARDRVKG
ncbi:MAG: hypothetical protein ACXVQY_08490, partial [Actinomycetota bacterium]